MNYKNFHVSQILTDDVSESDDDSKDNKFDEIEGKFVLRKVKSMFVNKTLAFSARRLLWIFLSQQNRELINWIIKT